MEVGTDYTGNYSRFSYDETERYMFMMKEQGIPILDDEFNLLQEIQLKLLRRLIYNQFGDGSPNGGFKIVGTGAANDFTIKGGNGTNSGAGHIFVSGYMVMLPSDILYSTQEIAQAALTTPSADRIDEVYIEVYLDEIDGTEDTNIVDPTLAVETSRRLKLRYLVKVAEGGTTPADYVAANGVTHYTYKLALIYRTATTSINAAMVVPYHYQQNALNMSMPVASTATGGALAADGANTWANIAALSIGQNANTSIILELLVVGGTDLDSGSARITVKVTQEAALSATYSHIDILEIHNNSAGQLAAGSFKLTAEATTLGTIISLWMEKLADYGQWDIYELSRNTSDGTIEYFNNAAWQSAIPTGAAENILSTLAILDANISGSSGSCTGNAASADTAAACSGNSASASSVPYSGLTGPVPTWNQSTTGNAAHITNLAADIAALAYNSPGVPGLMMQSVGVYGPGSVLAGSNLHWAPTAYNTGVLSGPASGTWMCLGYTSNSNASFNVTLWKKIAN